MSDVLMGSDLDAMIQRYLDELAQALSRLPAAHRDHLVSEIREHIAALRAERPVRDRSDMEALLNRVGLPEDIAAVALEDVDEATIDPIPSAAVAPVATPPARWRLGFSTVLAASAAGVIVLIVLLAGVAGVFRSGTHDAIGFVRPSVPRVPFTVTIPNVIGQSQAQAEATLASADLSATVQVVASSVAPGIVVTQSPSNGSFVPRNGTVELTVSSGPPPATTPTTS